MAHSRRSRHSSAPAKVQKVVSSRLSQAIFVIVCLVPVFSTVMFGAVDNTTWIFLTIFAAILFLLWIAESWNAGGILLSTETLQIPLLGLLLIGVVHLLPFGGPDGITGLSVPASSALSLDPYATRFFLSRLLIYAVFLGACLTFINSEARIMKVVLLTVIFGAIMAFAGILQRLADPDAIYGMRETPQAIPFGPFVNQHHFAAFMQMTSGLTLSFLFGTSIKRDRKLLFVIALVLMAVAAILTSSRGGLLGLASVVVLVVLINFASGGFKGDRQGQKTSQAIRRNVAIAAAAAGLIFVVVGVVLFIGGGESLLRGIGAAKADADFSSGRSHYWPIAIAIFLEHPIIGAGFDSFGVAYTRHDTWNGLLRVEQAHNDYLQILAEAGIAGFLCAAAFIFLLFKRGLNAVSSGNGLLRDASVGALAGCFGILIHSFFDFPLRTPSNAFFFLLLCSVAVFGVARKGRPIEL